MSSLDAGAPPWNIPTITSALSGALNRFRLANELFGGRAVPAGPVPPAHPAFALTEGVLALYPGYARDPAEDAREARQRWEAAAGPSLGTITIDFPSVFDPLYSASSVVTGILNEVLGDQFRPAVETYTTISRRVLDGYYGNGRAAFWFGWGPPLPSPDPRRAFIERYQALPGLPSGLPSRAPHTGRSLRDRTESRPPAGRHPVRFRRCHSLGPANLRALPSQGRRRSHAVAVLDAASRCSPLPPALNRLTANPVPPPPVPRPAPPSGASPGQ